MKNNLIKNEWNSTPLHQTVPLFYHSIQIFQLELYSKCQYKVQVIFLYDVQKYQFYMRMHLSFFWLKIYNKLSEYLMAYLVWENVFCFHFLFSWINTKNIILFLFVFVLKDLYRRWCKQDVLNIITARFFENWSNIKFLQPSNWD